MGTEFQGKRDWEDPPTDKPERLEFDAKSGARIVKPSPRPPRSVSLEDHEDRIEALEHVHAGLEEEVGELRRAVRSLMVLTPLAQLVRLCWLFQRRLRRTWRRLRE